ncbi:MAG: hypothetical protein H0U60_09820 [Blastocatellia bacterium]|nr:hypothetical protein [Blastocatellia bacterium]
MAKRVQKIYAIGTVRGRSTHFLATRETNFARARHNAIELIKSNTRWTVATISVVIFNKNGTEKDLKEIWRSRPSKRFSKHVLLEKIK